MLFEVLEAQGEPGKDTPVVVEIPHAGLSVDAPALATLAAPAYALGRDADLWVDELYAGAEKEGASVLVSRVSRYVCDLNRAELDVDGKVVEEAPPRSSPHGLIWRTTTDDLPALTDILPYQELTRRLSDLYHPYHSSLRQLIANKREKFGFCILLCAHSMPSRGRAGHHDPGHERADVVPGTRGRSTAASAVIDAVEALAVDAGYSVAHDEPYRGGYSTAHYGRPLDDVHAIQVELARRLYMDEVTLCKKPSDFEKTAAFCRSLVRRLGELKL